MQTRKYLGIIIAKTFPRHSWYLIFNHIIAFLTNITPAYFGISHHGVPLLHWHHVCVIISSFFPFRGVVVPFHLETALTKFSIFCDFLNLGHCCCIFVRPSREVLKNRFSLMEEQRLKINLSLVTNRITKGVKKDRSSLITNLVPEDIPTQWRSRFSAVDDAHPNSEVSELGQDCYCGSETKKYESTC